MHDANSVGTIGRSRQSPHAPTTCRPPSPNLPARYDIDQLNLCVLGGSGFIGAQICRLTVAMGHRPTSVSRRGRPTVDEPWTQGVCWVRADIFETSRWTDRLDGCEAVIHSIGIAREHPPSGQTFDRLHRQSVQLAMQAAAAAGVPKFVFISAAAVPPGVPPAFLHAKADAETYLGRSKIDVAILRPSAVYGADQTPGGSLTAAGVDQPALAQWSPPSGSMRVEKLAMAALRAALQPETTGVFDPDDIDHLGDAVFLQ